MTSKAIATLTMNPTIDISSTIDEFVLEHKMRCSAPQRDPGGGGINVARVVHRLGGKAMVLYIAGGATGMMLHKLLRREGIEDRRIEIEKLTRENFTLSETTSGRQLRFVFPGPELRRSEWQQCLDMLGMFIPRPAYIVASGSLPPGVPDDFYARAAQVARRIDARFILDTAGEPLRMAMEEGVFLIKPNRRELETATGRNLSEPVAQEEACRELVAGGKVETVVLTLGGGGALLTSQELQLRAGPTQVQVVSAVGAGDSFVGGLTYALARNGKLEEAFWYGMAAVPAAVLTPGTELCRPKDVERLFKELRPQKP
ncbi:MAG: 1-phosphofructokinase family hexose kinase [Desulfuromonadales bacterium]|nr:1-phosphofructokinase family hexose kinase [Desulfuromonadales bacterium]